jgi:hypothetical protein
MLDYTKKISNDKCSSFLQKSKLFTKLVQGVHLDLHLFVEQRVEIEVNKQVRLKMLVEIKI